MQLPWWLSFQNAVVSVFVAYMALISQNMYGILNPAAGLATHDDNGRLLDTLGPLWPEGTEFTARTTLALSGLSGGKSSGVEVWRSPRPLRFVADDELVQELNLTEATLGKSLWTALEGNKTVFVHMCLTPTDKGVGGEICRSSRMVRFVHQPPKRPLYYLVKDWPFLGQFVPDEPDQVPGVPASGSDLVVGYWQPLASARLVPDWTLWPVRGTPATVRHYLHLEGRTRKYQPVVYTDNLGLTKDKLVQVNTSNAVLPLTVHVGPMSLARWQFHAHMEQTLKLQKSMGASEKDIDDLRHMLTETDPLLLAVTIFVSLVHILLDVLAFKSDISFWSNAKSTKGLSVKTLTSDLVCQIIITAYLHEQSASLLVLVPSAVGVAVQMWKVQRAFRIGGGEGTAALDTTATSYMYMVLVPAVLAYSLYSLVYDKHTGFYGWGIGSLASSVYAFGFVMMTPQIFINYKLKSVAHLPWKFFIYKAANTFIDDLFAFIIRMPTMHRAACFRDDLVFFIYMYQRYIYPIDYSRKHEMQEDDDEGEEGAPPPESKKDK